MSDLFSSSPAGASPQGAGAEVVAVDMDEDFENAEQARVEFVQGGHSDRRCLICGGKFRFHLFKSSYKISCENGDFEVVVLKSRGKSAGA